jgi:hypothetical protein
MKARSLVEEARRKVPVQELYSIANAAGKGHVGKARIEWFQINLQSPNFVCPGLVAICHPTTFNISKYSSTLSITKPP